MCFPRDESNTVGRLETTSRRRGCVSCWNFVYMFESEIFFEFLQCVALRTLFRCVCWLFHGVSASWKIKSVSVFPFYVITFRCFVGDPHLRRYSRSGFSFSLQHWSGRLWECSPGTGIECNQHYLLCQSSHEKNVQTISCPSWSLPKFHWLSEFNNSF